MKSRSIRVEISLTILLAVFLLIVSCTTGPQNVSQNKNQNQDQVKTNAQETVLADDACNLGDINLKITKIKDRIVEKMNTKLKKQHDGDPSMGLPPRFKFDVRKSPNGDYLEAYFEDGVSGSDGLKDLADILNDFKKDHCLLKVYFVPKGSIPPTGSAQLSDGFEWTACEWPMVACPEGVCAQPPCVALSPSPRPANANTNPAANANSNSNRGRGNN